MTHGFVKSIFQPHPSLPGPKNATFSTKSATFRRKVRHFRRRVRIFKYRATRRPRSSRLACSKALEKTKNPAGTTGAEMASAGIAKRNESAEASFFSSSYFAFRWFIEVPICMVRPLASRRVDAVTKPSKHPNKPQGGGFNLPLTPPNRPGPESCKLSLASPRTLGI